MKYLLILLLLFEFITLGTSLKCYQNTLSPLDCKMETVICDPNESCFKKVGKIRKTFIASRGCISQDQCQKTNIGEFAGIRVSLKTLCCDAQLCNRSTELRTSLTMGSVLVFGWLICFL